MSRVRDLLVIVPSRGRPANVARLADALAQTVRGRVELALGLDDDDVTLPQTRAAVAGAPFPVSLHTGGRKTWAGWTNEIAVPAARSFRALCSLGDDHLPLTPGWDTRLPMPSMRPGAPASPTATTSCRGTGSRRRSWYRATSCGHSAGCASRR